MQSTAFAILTSMTFTEQAWLRHVTRTMRSFHKKKEKLNKVRAKGETSKLLDGVLEEKRREIIREWIDSGRIEA